MTLDLHQLPFADSVPAKVRQVVAAAVLVYEENSIERAVDRVAVRMTVELQDQNPVLVCVLPRGLVFTGMLMRRLVFPLQMTYVTAVDGRLEPAPDAAQMLCRRQVVLIDATAQEARLDALGQWLQSADVETVHTAVLVATPVAQSPDITYTALSADGQQLIGCGLDYQGYGANLPGLYAISSKQSDAH